MTDSLKHDLPDFDNPPVVETVLSVQFERLAAMRSIHFGLFWERVRERFPNTEEHPSLPPVFEQAKRRPVRAQVRFEAQDILPLHRVWFLDSAGTELMQIQNDRFIKNWRKRDDDQEYPRYNRVIKPAFERDFRAFEAFLADEKLGEVRVTQCEVTYVNHIVAGAGWNSWDESHQVFTFSNRFAEPYPGVAEDIGFSAQFPILSNNEWVGRLHVDVQAGVRLSDNKPMYAMNLTARGMSGTGFDFLDIGRQWVVNSFEHLTTAHMHKIWGKRR